jgi:hypothetical protein
MTAIARGVVFVGVVILVVGLGFAAIYFNEVNQQADAQILTLAEAVDQLEEWNSYQSTQIGAQQLVLRALLTGEPGGGEGKLSPTYTLTPYDQNFGVMIAEGSCCAGGIAGETIEVKVQFLPRMNELPGAVVEMRVITGGSDVTLAEMADRPWEPYAAEKTYPVQLATNWTAFWVHAQFRTADGAESVIYSDDISVEGMPGDTPTPAP